MHQKNKKQLVSREEKVLMGDQMMYYDNYYERDALEGTYHQANNEFSTQQFLQICFTNALRLKPQVQFKTLFTKKYPFS